MHLQCEGERFVTASVSRRALSLCDDDAGTSCAARIVTAFPLGGRIWRDGVAHSVCQSAEQLVGELLQDSTFSDGEDIRDSSADPMRVSFVDGDRLTFAVEPPGGCCLADRDTVPISVQSKGRNL
ncbi:hypothetical protein [Burkholderia sp. SIMBA_062]|uniref:hypothetical protein n=1 Tax=Burkholderia sp. SIMBA_062 TaxID=3085803 RepID=UPI003978AE32